MCAGCGCGLPEIDHGKKSAILWSDIVQMAEDFKISPNDVVNNIKDMVHASHKIDLKPNPEPLRDKDLKAATRELRKEITVDLLKGQTREETGRFVPGKSDTHSHKMGDEIVTHTHDGERGHQHPARNYGPSFHHR